MVNKYEIAANVEIAGIAGVAVKLTATEQKAMFGGAVFGKQSIRFDLTGQGKVTATRSATKWAQDTLFGEWTLDELAKAIEDGRELRA
jgi:hypothetical protein